MVAKESVRSASYMELNNLHLENVVNITVNSENITTQKKKIGKRKIVRNIVRFLTKK